MEAPNYLYGTGYGSPFLDGRKSYAKMPELKTGVQIGDFFHIDDLLDFSNEEIAGPIGETGNNWPNCMTAADSSTITMAETVSCNSSVDGNGSRSNTAPETDEHNPGDLCVPCDDLAELEWLSNFVEESFSTEEAAKPLLAPNFGDGTTENEAQKPQTADPFDRTASPMSVLDTSSCSRKTPSFSPEMRLPGRARSKRSRAPVCNWSSRIVSPTSSASALENGPTSSAFSSDSDLFAESSLPSKKIVKTNKGTRKKEQEQHIQTRRCMHCDTQKTPQWRTGPMGPKTLCNACGVRFKSGRLVPEYRPAASPSFVVSKHSNSHRKVLEMRRQKELELQFAACHGDDNHEYEYEDEDEDEDEDGDGDGSQEHHPYFGSDEDGYLLHTTQDYRHLI